MIDNSHHDLIYDWDAEPARGPDRPVSIVDETLRDGLQGGVPRLPLLEERVELLERSSALGIREAAVAFPAQAQAQREAIALASAVRDRRLPLRLGLLGRMVAADIEAIARVRDRSRASVTAWLTLPASRLRHRAEGWDMSHVEEMGRQGLARARELGLLVNLGIEDATRAEPSVVERFVEMAAANRVETVTICDTVGHLTANSCERIVSYTRALIDAHPSTLRLDFHGHADRGLGLANALTAIASGVDRVHATVLGIGERSGNTPLDLLLVNLLLMGVWKGDLRLVGDYCQAVAASCDLSIPENYPVFGARAFRTQAGIHATAILKALARGDEGVAATTFAGVDPRLIGCTPDICVGPSSGHRDVELLLRRNGIDVQDDSLTDLVDRLREGDGSYTPSELRRLVGNRHQHEGV